MQQRVNEPSSSRLEQQGGTIEQQSQLIQRLKEEATYRLECDLARSHKLDEQIRELSETSQLLAEDILQMKLKLAGRDQMLLKRGQKYAELAHANRVLSRHAQAIELSERELVAVLIPTKKRLALLRDTLTRFCYELEGIR
ncbi:hypothetical protein PHYSODRAFT_335987 [Phytophthora sojae]|uniref:Uncharacterized protein n=1 Tax=Phytophthora sojae (strain P6497) TaxID=1094619 RepID=G4ZS51_PHYSP|nr:hypothetical protein PHYSODRAFT_335987 [Phytophthora sojae]EGZ14347.1 hypothetical protein PHYSODRAFT_335987 [Phytophthora sojae]|eukprot:XP_009531776.1 hypothetical protein PHYSODRAFT_335987 [Phytophthora sojae]